MKNKSILFTVLIICNLSFVSCERNDVDEKPATVYDTIKPLNYFPVYPGSWWKYQINDTAYSIDSVSDKYQLHSYRYQEEHDYLDTAYTDSVYVPFYNARPIYRYDKIEWIRPPFGDYYATWPILSEQLGFEFTRDFYDNRYGDYGEHVKIVEKLSRNSDSIIVLKGYWGPRNVPNINRISIQEYKKFVGLTSHYIIDTIQQDTIYKKVISNYFINH